MTDDTTSLGALEAAATKPTVAPFTLTPLATVPQVSAKTKQLVIVGSLGLLAVALLIYWRSRS